MGSKQNYFNIGYKANYGMYKYQENSIPVFLSVIVGTTSVTGVCFFKIQVFGATVCAFLTATMKTHEAYVPWWSLLYPL